MTEEYTIGELEKKIGYQFRDKSLLKQALTHSSFANEQRINKLKDYERRGKTGSVQAGRARGAGCYHRSKVGAVCAVSKSRDDPDG